MTDAIRPTGVNADRNERVLEITWNDGKECRYSFAGLRAVCPCVECKGGHANMGGPVDIEVYRAASDPELNLEGVVPMGSYALQFNWSDGHWTGIYTWVYLREICDGA